jgi:hypothetical protein
MHLQIPPKTRVLVGLAWEERPVPLRMRCRLGQSFRQAHNSPIALNCTGRYWFLTLWSKDNAQDLAEALGPFAEMRRAASENSTSASLYSLKDVSKAQRIWMN